VLYYVNKTRDKGLSFDHAPEPAARSSPRGHRQRQRYTGIRYTWTPRAS